MAYVNLRKGLTLIEIMVVVAIVVLLAGILLQITASVSDRAKSTRTSQTIELTCQAVDAFHDETGYYPLAVPYDAWDNGWETTSGLPSVTEWQGNWEDYFQEHTTGGNDFPEFEWTNNDDPSNDPKPTNIHMLSFQLSQVPESNSILQKIQQNVRIDMQKKFVPDTTGGNADEIWAEASDDCTLTHPLDGSARSPYQIQDGWAMPLRYWTPDIMDWAEDQSWGTDIRELLSKRFQAANWGYFIESAGSDEYFGWWGSSDPALETQYSGDNIYSAE